MNFFRDLSKKDKKKFNKLNKEQQKATIELALRDQYIEAMNRECGKSFVRGVMFANNLLYDKYVTKWDSVKYDEKRKVARELVEEIRQHHEKSQDVFPKKEETKQEDK